MYEAYTNTFTFSAYPIMENFCIYGKKNSHGGKKGLERWIEETCSQEGEEVTSQDHPVNKHQSLAKTLPPATGWCEDSYV